MTPGTIEAASWEHLRSLSPSQRRRWLLDRRRPCPAEWRRLALRWHCTKRADHRGRHRMRLAPQGGSRI